MIGKKINQLATELAPESTDLTIIGDPTTGVSKKITIAQLGAIFSGAVSFYNDLASFPVTGDINVIYCAKDTQKLYLWSGSAYVEVFPSQALLDTYQLRSEKGNANGYASLDSLGKVPISQLPSSIMEYKGTWNAATNTPTLANGTGDTGDVYICNVAGTVNFGAGPITFAVGDYVIYSGTIWQRSSGAVGTVTSVAVSRSGDALTITGSPITTSGTINIGFAGTGAQYIKGDGTLATFPNTIDQAKNLITEVYNSTGSTLTKGTVVYINGGQGNLPTVTKALATGDSTSAQTYGIVQADITNNNNGFVVVAGRLTDIDTQAFSVGTQLYLSSTTAGGYTSTKQYAPNHLVYIGIIVRSHPTQGVIEVKIQNGYELDELHNVAAQTPTNNDGLFWEASTSLWKNKSIATVLGYTPANPANFVPYTGATGTVNLGTNDFLSRSVFIEGATNYQTGLLMKQYSVYNFVTGAYTQIAPSTATELNIVHNQANTTRRRYALSVAALQDGDTFQYLVPRASGTLALTSDLTGGTVTSVAALTIGTSGTDLSSTVANGTTTPVITLNVPTASATNRGALSSTDWTTFNNKQNALTNPITGISASGRVAYFNGDTSITGSSNFFWDSTNNRLGIGLNNPQRTLEIHNATADSQLRISGAAPSVSLGEAITGAIYQAKFGLITANGQYVTGGVAGDFVMISQTGATIFATSSTEKMRVQASGNVSIGNTNDTFRLDVTGTLRATGAATFSSSVTALSLDVISSSGVGSSTASGLARFITAGTTTGISVGQSNSARRLDIFSYAINVTGESFFLSTQSAHSIIFETNTAERMRINSVGDLLFAGSTTTSNQALITNDASFLKIYASNSSAPSKGIAFHYSNGSQTPEAMRITSGGVLKIGNGGTADDGLNPGYKNVAISFNNSQNRGEIQAVQQGLLVYPLILNGAGGNVGIGTYNPSQRLSVRSADNTSATNIARFAAENNTLAIGIGYETIRQTETGGSLFFETNGSPRMIITSGGNVEVRNQLHVGTSTTGNFVIISDNQVQRLGGGTLFINNSSTGDVSININGGGTFVNGTNGYGRAVTNSSDERIKKNIVTIDNALEKVIKMNGVYYEFNSQNKLGVSVPSEQKRIGLIAQQIEPILPEAVFTPKEANAPKSIDYSGMIGLLINAIQEQQQQIEQLKNK
jgi:hypothetical protein